MQTRIYSCILLLALVLPGCTEEEISAPTTGGEREISFTIQREEPCAQRAVLLEDGVIGFQAGDRISVFAADGRNCLFSQSGNVSSNGSATFRGKISEVASSYLALYPYQAGAASNGDVIGWDSDSRSCPIVIPDEQKAVEGSFDPQAFISVARSVKKSNSEHTISFKAACALVKFTIPESAGSFTFEKAVLEAGSGLLAGGVAVDPDDMDVSWLGPGSESITLTGTMKAGKSYYFCTDARQIEGITLSLYHYPSDAAPIVVKSSSKKVTLARNRVLDLGAIEMDDLPSKTSLWYGSGTQGDPYQISTLGDMQTLLGSIADSSTFRGCHFRMTDDIDCGGNALIGDGRKVEFCGVFDGNGHTLSDYLPSTCKEERSYYTDIYQGLFHRVYRATFRNLTLRPAETVASSFGTDNYYSLFLATVDEAESPTLIDGCRIEGDLDLAFNISYGGFLYFGAFVGDNGCDALSFTNCTNGADITFTENYISTHDAEWHECIYSIEDRSQYYLGGFVGNMYCGGKNSMTIFDRCRNSGDITFKLDIPESYVHCGGFIGRADYGYLYASSFSFTNCVNSGDIDICPGESNSSLYASGFIGFDQVDGTNSSREIAGEQRLQAPRFYNCLNKGDIKASGKGAHAAGFVFYSKHEGTDNVTQLALCVNIGTITGITPDLTSPYTAAISSGYGTCHWCWWLEKDRNNPVLPLTINGLPTTRSDSPYYCYCYPTINAETPENRRRGVNAAGGQDIVLDLNNSMWSHQNWLNNTVRWVGGSSDRSLDLDF